MVRAVKRISLTQGKEAVVSDRDYTYLSQWKWHYVKCKDNNGRGGYAVRTGPPPTKAGVYMHKEVARRMRLPNGQVDHRDRNKLNNQRCNLRPATNSLNQANCNVSSLNTSGFKGVHWYKRYQCWQASIRIAGQSRHLGYRRSKKAAAQLYNKAALHFFGKYAVLNRV